MLITYESANSPCTEGLQFGLEECPQCYSGGDASLPASDLCKKVDQLQLHCRGPRSSAASPSCNYRLVLCVQLDN
jgi:hypothetical protein